MEISTTLLTSMLSLAAMAVADFLVVFTIFRSDNRTAEDISLANCWMAIGMMHFLMVLRTGFFGMGLVNFDRALAYIVQILIVFVLLTLGHYVATIAFENKVVKTVFYFIAFGIAASFFCLFINFGLSDPMVSNWGTEYSAAWQANLVLMSGILIAFLSLVYALIKTIRSYKKTRNTKKLIIIVSLILFIIFSGFEQIGNIGWHVLLVRILILTSILTTYSAYELEKYKI